MPWWQGTTDHEIMLLMVSKICCDRIVIFHFPTLFFMCCVFVVRHVVCCFTFLCCIYKWRFVCCVCTVLIVNNLLFDIWLTFFHFNLLQDLSMIEVFVS